MDTITFENLAAFALGMAVVYMMFRSMGVFILLAFLLLSCPGHGQAQDVNVTNWPNASAPLPVQTTADVWPAALAGMSFGFTCCGFGMIIRMSRRVGNDT